ncbi:MAG TPA: hypothetical protein VFE51_09290 [Verrucomicrobiae bacterium]|nr:hypothetical protein [Verrucomicrobiae bacterium]
MSWRQTSRQAAVLTAVLTVSLWVALSLVGKSDARMGALLRANRLIQKLQPYQFSTTYLKITELTKIDLIRREHQRAEQLDSSLLRSGGLVSLWFLVPNLEPQETLVRSKFEKMIRNSENQVASWWFIEQCDMVCVHCQPTFVLPAQAAFCCITNRIPWGALRTLGGSRDDVDCYLPGGSLVDLDQCQQWLNENVAAGWAVGAMAKSERPGQSVIVASRGKRQGEVQPTNCSGPGERASMQRWESKTPGR